MVLLVAADAPLGPEGLAPPLKGEWADHRECHIGGDFLLVYQADAEAINIVRAGTHAELSGEWLLYEIGPQRLMEKRKMLSNK